MKIVNTATGGFCILSNKYTIVELIYYKNNKRCGIDAFLSLDEVFNYLQLCTGTYVDTGIKLHDPAVTTACADTLKDFCDLFPEYMI